ncbi:hypothetical protein C8Q78DRAFT_1076196 [Trametes maxima]|nr:hypothetical protein C8Q78DRAFT_1076196 [Trametes maxima]
MSAIRRLYAEDGIVRNVGQHLRPHDLCTLLLTDKSCNKILTPTLYRTVLLDQPVRFLRCLRTLSAPPGTHAFRRDLATLVHHFTIQNADILDLLSSEVGALGSALFSCLLRMDNLRHFSCSVPLPFALGVFGSLTNGSHPKLESIDLILPKQKDPCPILPIQRSAVMSARHPELRRFKLDIWEHLPTTLIYCVLTFLRNHAHSIRSLGLTSSLSKPGTGVGIVASLIPSDAVFPALAELEIVGLTIFSWHPALQNTTTIKSLYIHEDEPERGPDTKFNLPPESFPSLQVLTCPNAMVPVFLPENTTHRRPIYAVRLNEASYGMESMDYNGDQSDWEELLVLLPHLRFSAVPVTELSLTVWDLSIEDLRRVVPYLHDLEKLVIVVDEGIEDSEEVLIQLGPILIAQLPRLHTLLLSDMPIRVRDGDEDAGFRHARDIPLQRTALAEYEKHSSVLRRVAFAAEVGGWEKTGGQWSPVPSDYLIGVS